MKKTETLFVSIDQALADLICTYLNTGLDPRDVMRALMNAENKLADGIIKDFGADRG